MEQHNKFPLIYIIILYSCGFLLFLEWLYPLHILGTTDHILVFLLFAAFCFLISFLQLHWLIGSTLKTIAFIFIIQGLFYSTSLFDIEWVLSFAEDIRLNIGYIFARDWHVLTTLFRTTLFLMLIWLMSYLLYYWFVTVKRIVVFSICTLVYIGMLDTFAVYNGNWAIVRTFLLALFAFGLTNLLKDSEKMQTTNIYKRDTWKWIVPIIALPLFALCVGLFVPKTEGEWQDPISHVTSIFSSTNDGSGTRGGIGAVRKVGYGDNDEQLGGSFEFDETPVFRVNSSTSRYFRVESKEEYTGKGWLTEEDEDEGDWTHSTGLIRLNMTNREVDHIREEVHVQFEENQEMDKVVYPYGVSHVHPDEGKAEFLIQQARGLIRPIENDELTRLDDYTIDYNFPVFYEEDLQTVDETQKHAMHHVYTQLPDNLPERVSDLANSIIEGHDTQYEQVRAVERYFREEDFTYETTDVPIPEGDTDYVDQFLFDSQVGYCDNFSSAMVVLLRSQDIPTRWVKGFTGGSLLDEQSPSGDGIYEVTNANAHSWVEVYFPEVGWVPFEPTIGFSGASDIEEGPSEPEEEEVEPIEDDELEVPTHEEEIEQEMEQGQDQADAAATQESDKNNDTVWIVLAILLVIGLIVGFIYRDQWMMHLIYASLGNGPYEKGLERSMRFCLSMCQKHGLTKKRAETLRSFAGRVDKAHETTDMTELTDMYEQYMYSEEQRVDMQAYKKTWRSIMKQILT